MATNRSGSFCAAFGCKNCKSVHKDKHFFRFPKDKERSKIWVINCCRQDLMKKDTIYLTNNCRMCDEHFDASQFMNPAKDRLVWNAIPTIFSFANVPRPLTSKRKVPINMAPPSKAPKSSALSMMLDDHTYCSTNPATQNVNQSKFANQSVTNKIVKLPQQCRVKNELPTIESIIKAAISHGMKPATANFFHGQLSNCTKKDIGHQWTVQEKMIALGIFFRHQQAYRTLCTLFDMPSPTTLHRYVQDFPSTPGLCSKELDLLSIKVRSMNTSCKYCMVTFGEMSLKKELHYDQDRDEVDGFVHLIDRQSTICNQALVFMVRGLAASWKQPVAFYFSDNAPSVYILHHLLFQVLEAICGIGLKPTSVVCDQSSRNSLLYQAFGVKEDSPFFKFHRKRIYALYDVPQILENVRSNLKKQEILYDNGKVASWKDVQQFYNFDVKLPVRLAPKLTSKHIYFQPFSPMKANLAAQVCSHSVCAGIHTLVAMGKMSPSAAETANFLKQVNNVFDFLNVRTMRERFSKAITSDKKTFDKIKSFQKQVRLWSSAKDQKRLPCCDALLISLSAIKMLLTEIKKNGVFDVLLTGHINQDCLENFFSQLQCKSGYKSNLSAREFTFAYKSLATTLLLTALPSANWITDQDDLLVSLSELSQTSVHDEKILKRRHEGKCEDELPSKQAKLSETDTLLLDNLDDVPFLATVSNVVSYICGYVLSKIQLHAKCPDCLEKLTDSSPVVSKSGVLCHSKAHRHNQGMSCGASHAPSENFMSFLKRVEKVFQRDILKHMSSKGVLSKFLNSVCDKVPLRVLRLCLKHSHGEHVKSIIKLYVKYRLHYYFKFEMSKLFVAKHRRNKKVHILRHR